MAPPSQADDAFHLSALATLAVPDRRLPLEEDD